MKKKVLTMTVTCLMAMNADAQIYSGDTWMQMPTPDLYDNSTMHMALQGLEMMAAKYRRYSNMAFEAFKNKQWSSVICFVNEALETDYYSGEIYFIRGWAFEQLGNVKAAKKDYRKAKRLDCPYAARALEALKAKSRRR